MNFFKKISLFSLFALLLFSACRKDEILNSKDTQVSEPAIIVKGSISGMVVDLNDQPLEGVMVSTGMNNATTDENGYFSFKNIDINERGSMVFCRKRRLFL